MHKNRLVPLPHSHTYADAAAHVMYVSCHETHRYAFSVQPAVLLSLYACAVLCMLTGAIYQNLHNAAILFMVRAITWGALLSMYMILTWGCNEQHQCRLCRDYTIAVPQPKRNKTNHKAMSGDFTDRMWIIIYLKSKCAKKKQKKLWHAC